MSQQNFSYPFSDNLCSVFSCKGLRTFQAHTKSDKSSWLSTIWNSRLHVPCCSREDGSGFGLFRLSFLALLKYSCYLPGKKKKTSNFVFQFHASRINYLVRLWENKRVRVDWRCSLLLNMLVNNKERKISPGKASLTLQTFNLSPKACKSLEVPCSATSVFCYPSFPSPPPAILPLPPTSY